MTNDGNVASTSGQITLSLSTVGSTPLPGVTLGTLHAGLAIPPGKTRRYQLRVKVPASVASGSYYILVTVSLDNATALGSSPLTVS